MGTHRVATDPARTVRATRAARALVGRGLPAILTIVAVAALGAACGPGPSRPPVVKEVPPAPRPPAAVAPAPSPRAAVPVPAGQPILGKWVRSWMTASIDRGDILNGWLDLEFSPDGIMSGRPARTIDPASTTYAWISGDAIAISFEGRPQVVLTVLTEDGNLTLQTDDFGYRVYYVRPRVDLNRP